MIAITGAASGIGKATAEELHARGASLALSDVSFDQLKTVANELQNKNSIQKITATKVNVKSTEEIEAWFEGISKDFGRLDGAANIAGTGTLAPCFSETSDRDWEHVMSVNAGGMYVY